ncbi:MFS transporter [Paenibacillus swuensis]|uniref:MFS transporter n=1 Tax=Paenibacillus swuensis TaxID=1178515 RepID=A0A172TJD0_9BACL|nr:MFS transporter [Paenibacillus swuensis]ANE46957.1 MFS transporter [Paenibacillus swuensis]
MDYSANVWKLYAMRFFSSLIPAYVIERLYWEERGMTIQMVIYAELIYALTIVLLEVPTGILADRFGRTRMLVLSALLGCAEFAILIYATAFWHFAAVVFLAGISRSASSGSENALLYDTLKVQGKAASFERQLGFLNALDLTAAILAALCGSLLAGRFGLELNYWISLGSAAVAWVLSMTLKELAPIQSEAESEEAIPFREYVRVSLRFFRKNPNVLLVMFTGMITGAAMGYIEEFWQLYVDRLGFQVFYFGMISGSVMLLQLPGNILAHWLIQKLGYRKLLFILLAVFTIGFAYVATCRDVAGLTAMLIICACSGVMEPLASGYLHHRIDSSKRATMDSFQSLGENVMSIVAGLGFGYYATKYDVFGGYGFVAFLCLGCWMWFIAASRRLER